jgi:DNA repair exonuclease SbcCD ATPase subunit
MRLLHVHLRHVRLHRELAVTFHPRLTLLGGANETGKSTLVEALHKGLFLKASATGKGVEELRSSRHGGQPEVEIGFAAGGREWLLRKRFSGSSGTVQLGDGAGTQLSGPAAEDQLAALLGVKGPVEGRRISQLPQRWAHLWVRQGEAGANPLDADATSYDLERLVQQLQQRGSSAALESPLDRRVEARLQSELAQLFTATGKVKAGSPLASAQLAETQAAARLSEARERLAELHSALEELQRIDSRLQAIDRQERPALEAQLRQLGQAQRALEQAEARMALERSRRDPLAQQLQNLNSQLQQRTQLDSERRQAQADRDQAQRARADQLQQQQAIAQQLEALTMNLKALQAELGERAQALELGQLVLDQIGVEQRAGELAEMRSRFSRLQEEAAAVKGQLAALAPITAEQLQGLRQAERQLGLARARAEAMAATVSVVAADQRLQLDGRPLRPGEAIQIAHAADLQVGTGVRLRIQPGGGEALEQAGSEQTAAEQALAALLQSLAVADGDGAEQRLRQRTALEGELQQLRRAASDIPWQQLDSQIASLAARRRQLQEALAQQQHPLEQLRASGTLPAEDGLAGWLPEARQRQQQTQARWQALQQQQQVLLRQQQELQLQHSGNQLGELEGRLTALEQRHATLHAQQGDHAGLTIQAEAVQQQLAQHDLQLQTLEQELVTLRQQGSADVQTAASQRLQLLLAEKDSLLTQRGHNEQLCRSLGGSDPQAACEQAEAAWDSAREHCGAIQARADALRTLLERFRSARSSLADRYSQPMGEAIAGHLASLGSGTDAALLQFDASEGFAALQLRQGSESFSFERLSGGTREQVAAAVRLALAEVLAPTYDGVLPLVFDDAFTNSDPERVDGLQRMLERASGRGVQVLLFSCTPNDYADLAERIGSRITLNRP